MKRIAQWAILFLFNLLRTLFTMFIKSLYSSFIKVALLVMLTLLVISCSSEIEAIKHLDPEEAFTLHYSPPGVSDVSSIKDVEIAIDSEKHKRLIAWFESNAEGWQRQPNIISYNIEVMVSQKDLALLYWLNGKSAVLLITEGVETKEYAKELKPNELNFLTEDL